MFQKAKDANGFHSKKKSHVIRNELLHLDKNIVQSEEM